MPVRGSSVHSFASGISSSWQGTLPSRIISNADFLTHTLDAGIAPSLAPGKRTSAPKSHAAFLPTRAKLSSCMPPSLSGLQRWRGTGRSSSWSRVTNGPWMRKRPRSSGPFPSVGLNSMGQVPNPLHPLAIARVARSAPAVDKGLGGKGPPTSICDAVSIEYGVPSRKNHVSTGSIENVFTGALPRGRRLQGTSQVARHLC